jgi:hypothetical protein
MTVSAAAATTASIMVVVRNSARIVQILAMVVGLLTTSVQGKMKFAKPSQGVQVPRVNGLGHFHID